MEKTIKYAAYVVERQIKMLGEKAGWKVGFQPEACEEVADAAGSDSATAYRLPPTAFVQIGGYFIETTDREFFKQGVRYEVEMMIRRKA